MRFSLPCLLLALFPCATNGFVTPASRRLAARSLANDGDHVTQPSCRRVSAPTTRTSTQRAMGMFEDFLAGRNKETRSAANTKYLQGLATRVDRINALEATVEELGDDELTAKTAQFKQRLAAGEDLNGPLLEEAFAVVREAAW